MAATYLPTLKQLQYLVALRDFGHFGKAADACFVTQSTLSAGLRELESLLGVMLVERTRRVVRFTPLGERIAEKAQRVLREAEDLAALAKAAGKPLAGELRMSVIPTIIAAMSNLPICLTIVSSSPSPPTAGATCPRRSALQASRRANCCCWRMAIA